MPQFKLIRNYSEVDMRSIEVMGTCFRYNKTIINPILKLHKILPDRAVF